MSSQWRAMAFDICGFSKMKRFKPHLLMIVSQMCYTLLYFITQASFNKGLNPHVYVTYQHVVGGLVVFPFAYFLERYTLIHIMPTDSFLCTCLLALFSLQKRKAKADISFVFGNIFAFSPRVGYSKLSFF